MLKSMIRNGYQVSISLLSLVFMVVMLSPSAKPTAISMSWNSTVPYNNHAYLAPMENALVFSSQPNEEPVLLRFITRLIGNDWLGADWLYIGLGEYRYPALDINGQEIIVTDPVTGVNIPQWMYTRFWTDPGSGLLRLGDTLWVWGFDVGSHTVYADNILVNPSERIAPPDDVNAYGKILTVKGQTVTLQDPGGIRSTVTVDLYTTYSFPGGEGLPRPKDGLWLKISWLTGPAGLLGRYDGFHGAYRGILRLDFSQP